MFVCVRVPVSWSCERQSRIVLLVNIVFKTLFRAECPVDLEHQTTWKLNINTRSWSERFLESFSCSSLFFISSHFSCMHWLLKSPNWRINKLTHLAICLSVLFYLSFYHLNYSVILSTVLVCHSIGCVQWRDSGDTWNSDGKQCKNLKTIFQKRYKQKIDKYIGCGPYIMYSRVSFQLNWFICLPSRQYI